MCLFGVIENIDGESTVDPGSEYEHLHIAVIVVKSGRVENDVAVEKTGLDADLVCRLLLEKNGNQLASDLSRRSAQKAPVEVAALESGCDAAVSQNVRRKVVVETRPP